MRPHEERQPEPGQPRRAHGVDRDDEVQARQDRGEAGDEDADRGRDDVRVRRGGAVRGVKGPAGVDASVDHRPQSEHGADHVDVPGEQVQPRKGEIPGPDHHRDQEVAEHRRDRRDQEEEHHHDAVHREELVVGLRLHEVSGRRQELEPDQQREESPEEEEERDRREVEGRDPLVVARQQPRLHAVLGVQVVDARLDWVFRPGRGGDGGAHFGASLSGADSLTAGATPAGDEPAFESDLM